MASRFEPVTDDNLLQVLLTQPGMVYADVSKLRFFSGKAEEYRRIPDVHLWLAPGKYEHRMECLKEGCFVVLVEDDSDG